MTKPFDEAIKLKGICRFCIVRDGDIKYFHCNRADLGEFLEYCTKEDYLACPFNEVHMREMPQLPPKPKPSVFNKTPVPGSSSYIDDLKKLVFANDGQLYYSCYRYFDKLKKDVEPLLKDYDLSKEADRKNAWLRLIDYYAPPPDTGMDTKSR